MRRWWNLYLKARIPVNDILIPGLIPILLLLLIVIAIILPDFNRSHIFARLALSLVQKGIIAVAVYIIFFFSFVHYSYLDDIFIGNIKTYSGYVSYTFKSRNYETGGINPSLSERNALIPKKRLQVGLINNMSSNLHGKTFHCYYKKYWNIFEGNNKVEVSYLEGSKIIIDAREMEENIDTDFNENKKMKYIRNESKATKMPKGAIYRAITFGGSIAAVYVILVYALISIIK